MSRFRGSVSGAVLAAAIVAGPIEAQAISLNNNIAVDTAAVANIFDSNNTFPNVVWVHNCTGTLINSRTVLTAAHCFRDNDGNLTPDPENLFVKFSPDYTNTGNPNDRGISGVLLRSDYRFDSAGNDMAIVSLNRPVTAIAPVTLVSPNALPPAFGALAVLVGYGQYGTGLDAGLYSKPESQGGAPYDGRRRIGQTLIGGYLPWTFNWGRDPGDYDTIVAQFRDPSNPDENDIFGLGTSGFSVPGLQASNGAGDSGGPLFLVAEDGSLIQIGVLGVLEPSATGTIGYGTISGWEYVQNYLDWLYENNPLRSVSAAPRAGYWSDATLWSEGEVPNNMDGGFDTPDGYTGRYYDVWLSNASTVSVDISPQIDSLRVTNAQATLDITPDARLTVLLDTYISAGQIGVHGILDTEWINQVGGMVSGTGTIIAPFGFNNSGGIVAPGTANQLGTLFVEGNYTQGAAGTLSVRVDYTGSDQLVVSEQASLNGQLLLSSFQRAPAIGQSFTVAQAGQIEGGFSQISSQLPAFVWNTEVVNGQIIVKGHINYINGVPSQLIVDPGAYQTAIGVAGTLNKIAGRLTPDEARNAAASVFIGQVPFPSTLPLAIAGLNTMDAPTLGRTLETLPPTGFYGQSGFASQTSKVISGVLTDRLNELDGGVKIQRGFGTSVGGTVDAQSAPLVNAYAAQKKPSKPLPGIAGILGAVAPNEPKTPVTPFGVFIAGSYVKSGSAAESNYNTSALTAGLDYRAAPGVVFGAALTYAQDQRTAAGTRLEGSAVAPTLYGRFSSGRFFVDGYLGYAFGESDNYRLVAYGNQFLAVRASPHSGQALAGGQVGVKLDAATLGVAHLLPDTLTLTPFLGLDVTQARFDGYSEQGAGALSVSVASRHFSEARATAGVEAAWNIPVSFGVFSPRLKASVTQSFGDKIDKTYAAFTAVPDLPFQLSGAQEARNYGSLGAALGFQADEAISALISYQADIDRDGMQDNRFAAKVQYRF